MSRKIFITALCCIGCLVTHAQAKIKSLSIGQEVPDLMFRQVMNYPTKQAKLSDFHGKWVILDLWSTTCSACIEAFPRMDTLQRKFKEKLQILLVNPCDAPYDSNERIKNVLKNFERRIGFKITLPIPVHDSVVMQYFPYRVIPHEIWISPQRKLFAVTHAGEVTVDNLERVISGELTALPNKNDFWYDRKIPLFVDNNGGGGNSFLSRSIFTPGNKDLPGGGGTGTIEWNGVTLFKNDKLNYPLFELYKSAYPDMSKLAKNRIRIEPSLLRMFTQVYCYELCMPKRDNINAAVELQKDLDRQFGYKVKIEKRLAYAWVMTVVHPMIDSLPSSKTWTEMGARDLHKRLYGQPLQELLPFLNGISPIPVIDESGYTRPIDLDFPFDFYSKSIEEMSELLMTKGIRLEKKQRSLDLADITKN